ncbi:adenylate/guanylate cyclase domain-containing protein [Geminicoccus harenae]|uniref:adenylate/guanylate cyclase domain-containing protein n=1 Tax=Geminicoccus harenae TaxID=2498453 RepID=UPI00168B581D|nr:adenylate/guanylate cyclase domain-containing protein [Geminicoccus harenae]
MSDASTLLWPLRRSPALDWFVRSSFDYPYLDDLFAELCRRLAEAGLPLARATLHARGLHPQFIGAAMVWRDDGQSIEMRMITRADIESAQFHNSPVKALYEGAGGVRQRLDLPPIDQEFGIYADLRAEGFSDYVAMPLVGSDGRRHAVSFATRRPGGFATEDLITFDDLLPLLAMAAEARIGRRITKTILETYVGKEAGLQILAGNIRRGAHEVMDAAVWVADLAHFSELADHAPRDEVLGVLDTFFDAMGQPIQRHGGEILKFMGDAVMSVFRLDRPDAVPRALAAAREAYRNLEEIGAMRRAGGSEPLGYGLGLHLGQVIYGNIGTENRLDFTVIGPAVNEAARMERLSRTLGRHVVISDVFAAAAEGEELIPLGQHQLRGRELPIELFGLPEEEGNPWSYVV